MSECVLDCQECFVWSSHHIFFFARYASCVGGPTSAIRDEDSTKFLKGVIGKSGEEIELETTKIKK